MSVITKSVIINSVIIMSDNAHNIVALTGTRKTSLHDEVLLDQGVRVVANVILID